MKNKKIFFIILVIIGILIIYVYNKDESTEDTTNYDYKDSKEEAMPTSDGIIENDWDGRKFNDLSNSLWNSW